MLGGNSSPPIRSGQRHRWSDFGSKKRALSHGCGRASRLRRQRKNEDVTPGIGRRALDVTRTYFNSQRSPTRWNITRGYCGPYVGILDNYSGPGKLPLGTALPGSSLFIRHPIRLSGVGQLAGYRSIQNFAISIPANGRRVIGTRTSGEVEIDIPGGTSGITLHTYGWWRKLASALLWRPFPARQHRGKISIRQIQAHDSILRLPKVVPFVSQKTERSRNHRIKSLTNTRA